jgi:hypothetical protein
MSKLLFSQPGEFFYGTNNWDITQKIVPSPDGNFYLVGAKTPAQTSLVWLQKIDPACNLLWEKTYSSSTPGINEYGLGLIILPNGKLLIAGQQLSDDVFDNSTALAILAESDGTQVWKRTYANISAVFDAAPNGNGFLLVGWSDVTGSGDDGILMSVNGNGILQWKIPIEVYNQTYVKRIFSTNDGNFLMVGRSNVIGVGFEGVFLRKITASGDSIWQKTLNTDFREQDFFLDPGDFYTELLGAVQTLDGNIWVTNPTGYNSDIALIQFSQDGTLLQQKTYGNATVNEYPYSLTALPDGGWLMAGMTQTFDGTEYEYGGFAMRTAASGLEIWRKYYGKAGTTERLFESAVLPDGQFLLAGTSNSSLGNGSFDGWLLKAEEGGNVLPWRVEGQVVIDQNNDCQLNIGDLAASGWFITTNNGNAAQLMTDAEGKFTMHTDDATTIFTLIPPDPLAWSVCNNPQSVSSNGSNPNMSLEFVVKPSDSGCPRTEVSVTQPDLVRCETSSFIVTVTNRGVGESSDLLLELSLDPALKWISASEPSILSGNKRQFELSAIPGLQSKYIEVRVQLKCDVQLGATHAVVANLGPLECPPNWTGPQFTVEGICDGGSVKFDLKNIGGGGTNANTQYRVMSDYLLATDWVSINLPEVAATQTLSFPADGRTWRVEVKQAPGFPIESYPAATVEACGQADNFLHTVAYRNVWPFDDRSPNVAAILPPNTTGVPNKIGEALHGLGLYNLIENTSPLEYTVRLHNPLTVIGEKIEFVLKFSPSFDITTFQVVASNGPVELLLTEDGSIKAIMENLQLETGQVAGADAMLRFRISPVPGIQPDAGEPSLFLVEAVGYVNDFGPINIAYGFQNYSVTFPTEMDEYNTYPPEIILYGDRNYTFGTGMAQAADGAVFLIGETSSYSDRTNYDGLLVKTNRNGRAFWLNAFDLGDGGLNTFIGVAPLTDGGCLTVGNYVPPTATTNYISDYTPYFARIAADGKMLWHKKIRPAGNEFGAWAGGIVETADGNFVVYGYTQNTTTNGIDQFYVKIDENGEVLWLKHELVAGSAFNPNRAILSNDGHMVFCGENQSSSNQFDIYFEKIDNDGNTIWKKGFNSSKGIFEYGIAPATDGGIMLAGTSQWEIAPNDYGITPTFMKFNPNGDLDFEKNPIIGPFNIAYAKNIIPAPGGGYLVGGEVFADTLNHFSDLFLLKIDENADTLWWRGFGAKNTEWVEDLVVSDTNQVLLWGFNQSRPPLWDLRSVLARTNLNGDLFVDSQETPQTTIHQATVFPNPSNDMAYVVLSPYPVQAVEWALFDINGKQINHGKAENGFIELQVAHLSKGIYFLCFPGSKYPSRRLAVIH